MSDEIKKYLPQSVDEIEDGFIQKAPSASREFIPSFDGTGV